MKCNLLFFPLLAATLTALCLNPAAAAPQPLPVSASWSFPMVISPNGRYLATTGTRSDAVELYDLKTGKLRILTTVGVKQFYDYRMTCYAMAFSPDSKTLAHGGAELGSYSAINTWNTATGSHLKTFAPLSVGQNVLYTRDGKTIVAAGRDNRVHFWNAATGQAIKTIPGSGGQIVSLALSPDGRRIAIGTIIPGCVVQVRELRSGRVVWTKTPPAPEATVSSLAFSPDGRTLAQGGQYNKIYLHDARTGAVRETLSDPAPATLRYSGANEVSRTVAYSPDGKRLAGGGVDRVVVWSAQTNKVIQRISSAGMPFAFLPSNRSLAATEDYVPSPHPAHSQSYLMHPPRRGGNVSLWPLK